MNCPRCKKPADFLCPRFGVCEECMADASILETLARTMRTEAMERYGGVEGLGRCPCRTVMVEADNPNVNKTHSDVVG